MKAAPEMYDDFPSALDGLTAALGARKFDPDVHYVVLTPDRYTLQVEGALFGNGGAIDCEVLTLSRLARRVVGDKKVLSREGAVMLVSRAVLEVKDKLGYYAQAAKYYDFARQVYDTILQISASGATLAELRANARSVTAAKLADLELIAAEYERQKNNYLDASDRLTALIDAIPTSGFVKHSRFYLIGYRDATRLNNRVFDEIEKHCEAFYYFDAVRAEETPHGNIEVYRTPDAVTGYKAVAARIVAALKSGVAPRDISVICPEARTASRIFREYGIDFYADEAVTLDRTQPTALLALCNKLKKGNSADDVVALCKNPFSGCDDDDAELLQNYLAEHGLERCPFSLDVSGGAKRALCRAEEIVNVFSSRRLFAEACEAVMEFCGFEATSSGDAYRDKTDMLAPLIGALAEVKAHGTGIFEADAVGFLSMAKEIKVKSRPRFSDQVTVCLPPTLRMSRCKLLFITDFNEGVLPSVTQDSGLLSDVELNAFGGAVEPTARDRNKRDRAELTAVINNSARVFCTYSVAGGAHKAAYLTAFAGDKESRYSDDAERLASGDFSALLDFGCTVGSAREIAARGMTPYADDIRATVGDYAHASPAFSDRVGRICRKDLSVSELSRWFDCPYKRFLTDSVGLTERKRGRTAADLGTVMHEFMRRFMKQNTYDTSPENIFELMRETLEADDSITADERGAMLSNRRFMSDAAAFAETNKYIIEQGLYRPKYFEKRFPNDLTLGAAKVPLTGIIDRIDVCGDRARIIDYKTGGKKFDERKCLNGRDMQLPIYAVAAENMKLNVTGMFFATLGSPFDGGDRRLRGCVIKEVDVVKEYDGKLADGLASDVISAKFTAKGAFNEQYKSGLYTRERFRALIDECKANADCAADEISLGYIERTPADGACDYCAFTGLCPERKYRDTADEADDSEEE